ncbi:MAG: hypothetical protein JWR18_496 [Segetibacter sp.]|jgi:hypothetical protein|nr:hypothetical protein [Segetibacter sp.]
MELNYKYREHLKEYSVEEDGYYYYMPISYILRLKHFCEQVNEEEVNPVKSWYQNLKDIERRIVVRKSKDDEKLCSIW